MTPEQEQKLLKDVATLRRHVDWLALAVCVIIFVLLCES